MYKWLLFGHLIAVTALIGALGVNASVLLALARVRTQRMRSQRNQCSTAIAPPRPSGRSPEAIFNEAIALLRLHGIGTTDYVAYRAKLAFSDASRAASRAAEIRRRERAERTTRT